MDTYQDYLNEWEQYFGDVSTGIYSGHTVHRLSELEFESSMGIFTRIYRRIEEIQSREDYGTDLPSELIDEENKLFHMVAPYEIALLA